MHSLLHSESLLLKQATTDTCLCWSLLDTHGHVWISFLWVHCSCLLGPGAEKVLFVPSKNLFPCVNNKFCVSSGGSAVGLMLASSKRPYVIPRSAAPNPLQQAADDTYLHRRHSDTVLAQSLWVGPVFYALPSSEYLRQPRAWWAHCSRWLCVLITSLDLAARFPGCAMRAPSQVCCMSPLESWSQAATFLADVNHPGSQENMISSWDPAHSLVEDAISGAEIEVATLIVTSLPLCLWVVRGW